MPRLRQNSRTASASAPPLPLIFLAEQIEHDPAVGRRAAGVEREQDRLFLGGGRSDGLAQRLRESHTTRSPVPGHTQATCALVVEPFDPVAPKREQLTEIVEHLVGELGTARVAQAHLNVAGGSRGHADRQLAGGNVRDDVGVRRNDRARADAAAGVDDGTQTDLAVVLDDHRCEAILEALEQRVADVVA